MAEANQRPTPCPRCKSPITGEFKFCPTCAYRLRGPEEDGTASPTGSRWPAALAGALFLALIAAVAALGLRIFEPKMNGRANAPLDGRRNHGPLTVERLHGDLFSETLRGGVAASLLVGGEEKNVAVDPGRMLIYEVTRGMWAEFLQDLRQRRREERPWPMGLAFLEELWRPPKGGKPGEYKSRKDFSDQYIGDWWNLLEAHLRRAEARLREQGLDVDPFKRPKDLQAPLPRFYDLLLLTPPSWIHVTGFEDLAVRMPPGTENLPVTEVSWYEAVAFSQWVNDRLGLETRLPTKWEWLRAGNSGNPERKYPWGNTPYFQACNCSNHWDKGDTRRLRPVAYRYSDHDGHTLRGNIYAMSGNAREWCLNSPLPGGQEVPESSIPTAPTCGGSYLRGIADCTVTVDSIVYQDKWVRSEDLGFRLWMGASR